MGSKWEKNCRKEIKSSKKFGGNGELEMLLYLGDKVGILVGINVGISVGISVGVALGIEAPIVTFRIRLLF